MENFCVVFYIFLFSLQFTHTQACNYDVYAGQPIHEYRCISSDNSVISLLQTDRPQCVWNCLRLETCRYINHNYGTGQCDIGLAKCDSLAPMVDGTISAFGPHRKACLHWGSSKEAGKVPVEVQDWTVLYLARMMKDDTLVVGKYDTVTKTFFANNEGIRVVDGTDEGIEFLTMDPTCSLLWMPYTAGNSLPAGLVSGGRLPDECTTYVCKVIQDGRLMFGYYNTESELAYYELAGVRMTTSMELLVLL